MDERKLTLRGLKEQLQQLDKLDIPDSALIVNAMVLSEKDQLVHDWMMPPGTIVLEVQYPITEEKAIRHAFLRFQPPIITKNLS